MQSPPRSKSARFESWIQARKRTVLCLALAALLMLALFPPPTAAQISPGPLSKAHSSLAGATQCTTCHNLGVGEASFKCLDCHREIATRLTARRGLHAAHLEAGASSRECIRCHSEHNGEDFALVRWQPSLSAFDHSRTGYRLEGKHAAVTCARCHTAERISPAERAHIQIKDLKRSYLGLSRDCISCHADKHLGQLGNDCQRCHTFSDWKATTRFDHGKTRFPLTGAHAEVTCRKCHKPGADPRQPVKYVGVAFDRCTACHSDPHREVFRRSCDSCHNTANWKRVTMAEAFDHSRTKFALLGKHAGLGCGACHKLGDFKKPLAYQRCADCHKPDPHGGQFLKRAEAGECKGCHTVEGFKPARFALPEHAASAYPLEGKHVAVGCEKCHLPAGKATVFKLKFAHCTDCHKDRHEGQFAAGPNFNACEACHTVQGYHPSTFTIVRHKATRFPLAGGHVAVACLECHKPVLNEGRRTAIYHFADSSCEACHQDPHRGQFKERMLKAAGGSRSGCEACHSTRSWRDQGRFDHASTGFPLQGAHLAAPCSSCHKAASREAGVRAIVYRLTAKRCEDCHADIHAGQFALRGVTRCDTCHNPASWRAGGFDHEKRTRFPLLGAHQKVQCSACHKLTMTVAGRRRVVYKNTPQACIACHGPTLTKRDIPAPAGSSAPR